MLGSCEWYGVYDFAEGIYAALDHAQTRRRPDLYEERLNKLFRERGVGWQMQNGKIMFRALSRSRR